jgi:hypothetical protein
MDCCFAAFFNRFVGCNCLLADLETSMTVPSVTSVLLLLILLDQRRGVPESIPGVGTEALANGRQWVTSVSAHETKPGIFRVIAAEIQTKEANFVGNDKGDKPLDRTQEETRKA